MPTANTKKDINDFMLNRKWVCSQISFSLHNSTTRTTKRYYGRFNMKSTIQKRTLKRHHRSPLRGKTIQVYEGNGQCFFLDDKAAFPIGPHEIPVSTTKRQREWFKCSRPRHHTSSHQTINLNTVETTDITDGTRKSLWYPTTKSSHYSPPCH